MQKRVGSRLRKLKNKLKASETQGLNDACIDRLQNYYGIAVRSNVGNLANMKKSIYAALMHVASSKENNYHWAYCPAGDNSWCSFQRDEANKTNIHIPSYGLAKEVIKHVKPILEDLSKDDLLSRCLHGKTQNQNLSKSFNGTIWNRVPKQHFIKLKTFGIGVYDSVAYFNAGNLATLLIYDSVGIEVNGRWIGASTMMHSE